MRLRVDSLALVGTSREVRFKPGLNVVLGPISTGKTSLMKLLEVFLGGGYSRISNEVNQAVTSLAGQITVGEGSYSIVRPLVQTDTARVQIAGDGVAERLPAMRAQPGAPVTYGVWLLDRLGLPVLRVPQAPTRPEDSAFSPLSINDYLLYCRLRQDEIDVDIFGSSLPFRDIKRRYVFRVLYGGYDTEVATLQDELRRVQTELTQLQGGRAAFDRFLQGTALENRAVLDRELEEAQGRLSALRKVRSDVAATAPVTPEAVRLRAEIASADQRVAELGNNLERERRSANQLIELANDLQAQSSRLTRAIVAGERFVDFEFIVCPRCGSSISSGRAQPGHCNLCLQEEPPAPTREELIREQDRVNAQIGETEELIKAHERRAEDLQRSLNALLSHRSELGRLLDRAVASFVSDQAERLELGAREEAALVERETRVRDYLVLYRRLDDSDSRITQLEQRRAELEASLERAEHVDALTASRIERLAEWFAHYVDALGVPEFGTGLRAGIDRNDYQPIVNGQKFPQLSAGVRVLVNIAHALAHHRAALELELPLPGLIWIDGVTKNIGTAGYDHERIEDIWTELLQTSDQFGEQLQLIVAANDVPARVKPYVRLELAEDDRLIPEADLKP
ncbi:MAG: hypothetical protein M3082_12010 [Candidatus Dormibacteraeota bacterium]|nr:hypothetical protein [Candidatus Dormibacteraeota bacterium]